MLNPGFWWYSSFLVLVLLVLLAFGFYELYSMLEPLNRVWSVLLAKLSDISLALSEQASELKRLQSLLSEYQTTKLGSESAVANAIEGQARSWPLLSEVQSLFAYIMFVYERVWRTLGLVLVTSVTGLFSWLDWSCMIFQDLVTRVYSDPKGLLINLLLFVQHSPHKVSLRLFVLLARF